MKFLEALFCPVCHGSLHLKDKTLKCENNHSFDLAKEGYVNLLTNSHKSGDLMGDNKSMALSRQDFLNKGYFESLASALSWRSCNLYSAREVNILYGSSTPFVIRSSISVPM